MKNLLSSTKILVIISLLISIKSYSQEYSNIQVKIGDRYFLPYTKGEVENRITANDVTSNRIFNILNYCCPIKLDNNKNSVLDC